MYGAPGTPRQAVRLLSPDVLDLLPLIGSGRSAQVRRHGVFAVKVAHPSPQGRARLQREVVLLQTLARAPAPIFVPRLFAHTETALVRSHLALPSVAELLSRGGLSELVLRQLWELLVVVRAAIRRRQYTLDFTPANLFVDAERAQIVFGDLGERTAANPYLRSSYTEFARALDKYTEYSTRLAARAGLLPVLFPPSGRFAVEVPLGPDPKAKILWTNERLLGELEGIRREELDTLGALSTHTKATVTKLASRYQDSPTVDAHGAKGDGRSIYLGRVGGGPYGQCELQLKGCGPTPLAWQGHAYHEDGLVSFPRTLWETTVADELRRLGFDVPETLAISGRARGARTIDNTKKSWPAAASIRVSPTHFRLGHLCLWSHERTDRPAFVALLEHVGQSIDATFQVGRAADVQRLVKRFCENLGHDVGKSDALNIHCFHPTLGNVRIDGHFIDFSTVRIFRHYVPDYVFLNDARRVGGHWVTWRRPVLSLVEALARTEVLPKSAQAQHKRRALGWFDGAYVRGYLEGLSLFLGWPLQAGAGARTFVEKTKRVRALRGVTTLRFPFFGQECRGPLFDLEDRSPMFVDAWRRGLAAPYRKLLWDESPLDAQSERVARAWVSALEKLAGASERPARIAATPRRFHEVIRPFTEINALAALCYEGSTPKAFATWQARIATSRHLPPGVYTYEEARAVALHLGHLVFVGAIPGRSEVVVGMTRELYAAVVAVFQEELGATLIGICAHGSRVMTKEHLRKLNPQALPEDLFRKRTVGIREFGPDPRKSSDLDLKVFVRRLPRAQLGACRGIPDRAIRSAVEPAARSEGDVISSICGAPSDKADGQRRPKRDGSEFPDRLLASYDLELTLGRRLVDLGARFPLCGHDPPRQRVIVVRARTLASAFRRYNVGLRQSLQQKVPIPLEQVVWFFDSTGVSRRRF